MLSPKIFSLYLSITVSFRGGESVSLPLSYLPYLDTSNYMITIHGRIYILTPYLLPHTFFSPPFFTTTFLLPSFVLTRCSCSLLTMLL